MDHAYSTQRIKHQSKDHCYFSIGKKTPKVIHQRIQESLSGKSTPIVSRDHTYVRALQLPQAENTEPAEKENCSGDLSEEEEIDVECDYPTPDLNGRSRRRAARPSRIRDQPKTPERRKSEEVATSDPYPFLRILQQFTAEHKRSQNVIVIAPIGEPEYRSPSPEFTGPACDDKANLRPDSRELYDYSAKTPLTNVSVTSEEFASEKNPTASDSVPVSKQESTASPTTTKDKHPQLTTKVEVGASKADCPPVPILKRDRDHTYNYQLPSDHTYNNTRHASRKPKARPRRDHSYNVESEIYHS